MRDALVNMPLFLQDSYFNSCDQQGVVARITLRGQLNPTPMRLMPPGLKCGRNSGVRLGQHSGCFFNPAQDTIAVCKIAQLLSLRKQVITGVGITI
ncbi:MAG TPA: hypothetical protein DCP03_22310 [Polaromonas sp.]|uniref:hypothetical protein n=1 Tax=Polaromonas sp. UBA4122 TaxID=1947074 RepID=UPI000EE70447|nr:hypothetical protein [Polaromonas sp. UBA4122]HAL40674.1 hypothetical protein [Polaromonas sp.]